MVDDFVPAAAFCGTGKGFSDIGMGLEAQGVKGVKVLGQPFAPDGGNGEKAGDGLERFPKGEHSFQSLESKV